MFCGFQKLGQMIAGFEISVLDTAILFIRYKYPESNLKPIKLF